MKVVKLVIDSAELRALFEEAAKKHDEKANYYKGLAAKIELPEEEAGANEDDDWKGNYGSSVRNDLRTQRKSLQQKAFQHEQSAQEKRFIAAHLRPGQQELRAEQIKTWGLLLP